MRPPRLIVLKLGGSVLRDRDALVDAVVEIARWRRGGWGVVAVVSALAGETDALIAEGARAADDLDPFAAAALLATGELACAARLGVALDRFGVPATVLTPGGAGLRAAGPADGARALGLDVGRVRAALQEDDVVVVPGFVACDARGRLVTLGRGGSDQTALFTAHALGGVRCRLVKDVDGLFERDPATPGPRPRRFAQASWESALRLGGAVVQPEALRFARAHGVAFEIAALGSDRPTHVGPTTDVLEPAAPADPVRPPLRVAFAGLGTVGGGALSLLARYPASFVPVGALVRDPGRARVPEAGGVPSWTERPRGLWQRCDVLVEALGGTRESAEWTASALGAGVDVVTANKALLAECGDHLRRVARRSGARLLCSAAVGGGIPVLERLLADSAPPVRALRAVLNGTTNLVLDEVAAGARLAQALASARARGLTEGDGARDLSGRDAADKLCVVARALGRELAPEDVTLGVPRFAAPGGRVLRQVAELELEGAPRARVATLDLAPDDALARTRGVGNAVQVLRQDGTIELLRGRGAGRWPTALSVLGDLFHLRAEPRAVEELPTGTRGTDAGVRRAQRTA